MKNLIKAQLYQLKKNRILILIFLALCIMQVSGSAGEMAYQNWELSAGGYLAANGLSVLSPVILIVTLVTAEVCGADFMDKTGNYELMAGYRRKDIFFSRTVLSVLLSLPAMFLLLLVWAVAAIALGGWGTELSTEAVLARMVLLIFPIFRLVCEFVFLSYVIKNQYIVMGCGLFLFMGNAVLSIPEHVRMFSSIGSIHELVNFSSWATFRLVDEKEIRIYESAISSFDVLGIAVISVLAGVLFLWLGYQFYKKDDLH